jgi:hypothetical protein
VKNSEERSAFGGFAVKHEVMGAAPELPKTAGRAPTLDIIPSI